MKETGIVRRVDELGRIVIPKEIRKTLMMREGDQMEIYMGKEGEILLKKYSPLGQLGQFAASCAKVLGKQLSAIVYITDTAGTVITGSSNEPHREKKNELTFPIRSEGEAIGEIIVCGKKERVFTEAEKTLVQSFSALLGMQLEI